MQIVRNYIHTGENRMKEIKETINKNKIKNEFKSGSFRVIISLQKKIWKKGRKSFK